MRERTTNYSYNFYSKRHNSKLLIEDTKNCFNGPANRHILAFCMKLEFENCFFFSVDLELETASVVPFVVRARPGILIPAPIHGGGGGLRQRSNESDCI